MDEHISKDPCNPINWDGKHDYCESCNEILCYLDWEDICNECWEKQQNGIEDAENLKE